MKIRTIKLREAHNNGENGGNSFCSILWNQQGDRIVTASSSDPSIWIHDAQFPSVNPKAIKHHRDGVTALALSPDSTCLASGSIDHSVKLFKFPGGEFETNITRFTLPIRALAFNKSGTMLAAAGDDEGIKLINTIDGSIARVLKGQKGSITGLAFDPKSEYFASYDSTGTVIHWELEPGTIINTLKGVAPAALSGQSVMNVLSWSPDGDLLAVPGLKNDVVMYDRDTAEKLFSLRGDHVQPICCLSWSPNGKYMATSGLDKQIMIWDVEKKQDIDRQKFSDRISCMAWKPHGNALAVIDIKGKYGVWESTVPSSLKSPTKDIPSVRSNGLLLFDEEEEEASASASLSDLGEDSFGESEPPSRKRLRKNSTLDDGWEEDVNNELDLIPKVESHKEASKSKRENVDHGKNAVKSTMTYFAPNMQEAFQPGATPVQPGKRRFLCYNMLGSVTSMDHEGYSHIEIDFHDAGSGPRVPAMTDYFGFTMASVNENGSVFANPCKGEKNMSTLMYRPFSSWASNSEWSMRLEEEEIRAVALGTSWVAAATSLNFLRIFTNSGLQRYILSLNGPVVTLAGFKDELAVVTHSSPSLPSNEQMLEFIVLNIRSAIQSSRGRLPLTPGSYLTWFGFSEDGQLGSFDSKIQKRIEQNAGAGKDTASLDDEAFTIETALDRCILRLIASCCNGDKLVRATELVKLLSMEKSVRGAIKLVTALKLPNLAERFNTILEERMMNEAMRSTVLHSNIKGDAPVQADDGFCKPSLAEGSKEKEESVSTFPHQRSSSPFFLRKPVAKEPPKDGTGMVEPTRASKVEKAVGVKPIGQVKNIKEATNLAKQQLEEIPVSSNRPCNPFAKKSNMQENSSLFSSLKKVKTDS